MGPFQCGRVEPLAQLLERGHFCQLIDINLFSVCIRAEEHLSARLSVRERGACEKASVERYVTLIEDLEKGGRQLSKLD